MTPYKLRYGMLALFIAMACGGTEEDLSTETTKIVNEDGLQFVFDLVTPAAHQEMMEAMDLAHEEDHSMHAEHKYVMLTVIDIESGGSTLTQGDVSFAITGPDGNPLETSSHVMSGMGMHHFAAHFEPSAAGNYSVRATLTREGKDPVNATAVFSL